jgi:pimeloyl-ACP methyl ester carboxylesterase
LVIESGGSRLLGGVYTPVGPGPHPAVVMLHGLPGNEKNMDLAQALRACGFVVVFFSYRGAWGSEGDFHFDHLIPDTRVAIDALLRRPDVDAARFALLGMSLGGWVALATTAEDDRVTTVVAVAPLIDPNSAPIPAGLAEESSVMLDGITPQAVASQWAACRRLVEFGPRLAEKRILLVTADRDAAFPPSQYHPFVAAFPQTEWVRFPTADHLLSSVRAGLTHVVTQWLLARLG